MSKRNYIKLVAEVWSFVVVPIGILIGTAVASSAQVPVLIPGAYNQPGDILIADQFNNRVIEIQPNGKIVWQFGLGPNDFSPRSIIGCNDAQRVGPLTLMAGTGTPPGVVTNTPDGTPD